MTLKFPIISVLLLTLMGSVTHAQTSDQRITGNVVGASAEPLPAATVALIDTKNKEVLKALADSNGRFSLSHPVKGKYTIQISYTGYASYRSELFELMTKDLGTIRLTILNVMDEVSVPAKPE